MPHESTGSQEITFTYVAGEASGDRHAAALHQALIDSCPVGVSFHGWGIGGDAMQRNGIRLISHSGSWGAIGIVESVLKLPTYLRSFAQIKRELLKSPPSALVLVDFGAFNVTLAKWARRRKIGPIIYFLPPGSWKRHANPVGAAKFASLCDMIITPFQWSNNNLRAAGGNSHWLGHPLIDMAKPTLPAEEFEQRFGIDPQRPLIALLPGSRTFEVKYNLPVMLKAAAVISKRVPGTQFLLASAPNLSRAVLEDYVRKQQQTDHSLSLQLIDIAEGAIKRIAGEAKSFTVPSKSLATSEGILINSPLTAGQQESHPWVETRANGPAPAATLAIVENLTYDCLARADLAIMSAGTATLEAAILNRPMITIYRGSPLMELEYHLRKKRLNLSYIGLPNILADEMLFPEFRAREATPEAVAEAALSWLIEPERLMRLKQKMQDTVVPQLGEPGVAERAADLIWSTILPKRAVQHSAE